MGKYRHTSGRAIYLPGHSQPAGRLRVGLDPVRERFGIEKRGIVRAIPSGWPAKAESAIMILGEPEREIAGGGLLRVHVDEMIGFFPTGNRIDPDGPLLVE